MIALTFRDQLEIEMVMVMKSRLPGIVLVGLCLMGATNAMALSDRDVRRLQDECEAAREVALEPVRARRTQACIDQQLRSPDRCERYYTTYGNVAPGPTGAPQPGLYYDLPECQAWTAARDELRQSRSR